MLVRNLIKTALRTTRISLRASGEGRHIKRLLLPLPHQPEDQSRKKRIARPQVRFLKLAQHNAMGNSKAAFSLVEVVIVIAIIAAVSTIAIPKYANSLVRYRVDAAARRIAADLELARSHARRTSQSVTVDFQLPPTNTLTISGISHLDNPASTYSVDFNDEPYVAQLTTVNFGGSPYVSFDGYGKPLSGGTVRVRLGGTEKVITLNGDSGTVTLQ